MSVAAEHRPCLKWHKTLSFLKSPGGCSPTWLRSCHFLPLADSLQVLNRRDNRYVLWHLSYCLKHPGLEPVVIFCLYTFQGTNNVMNYEVNQREDVSVQETLETEEPLITLSRPAWKMEQGRVNNFPPCQAMHQTFREGQDCSIWLQVTGKWTNTKSNSRGRPGLSLPASCPTTPLQYMACGSISAEGKPWSHMGHNTWSAVVGLRSATVLSASSSPPA